MIGVYDASRQLNVASIIYLGLFALQHRGQESCGISVQDGDKVITHKDIGLVVDNFDSEILARLKGSHGIGHVRYAPHGCSGRENTQPIEVRYRDGMMALAHNGNLTNTVKLRREMADSGAVFIGDTDTELVLKRLCRYLAADATVLQAVMDTMQDIRGAYAIVATLPEMIVGFRDPHGLRPLCLGKYKDAYILASESCAFSSIGAEFIRDIRPGEIVIIDDRGLHSHQTPPAPDSKLCIFEYVYFARPDSYMDEASIRRAREEAGRILAQEHPVEADLVIGAPDSALTAAVGFARASGIPFGHGLIRSRYVARTFIQPTQEMRDAAVRLKFSVLRDEVENKRIVMVDDSIVRGTTTSVIVQMLKDAGATEVHMRISSPPVKFPCYYGIDTATANQLIASHMSEAEICRKIGADSLGYLSIEGLRKTPVGVCLGLCDACFTGNYFLMPEE